MQKTIGTTPELIANANPHRTSLAIKNESTGGQTIYIGLMEPIGLTTTNADYALAPGEGYIWLYKEDGKDILSPFSVVSSGAGGIIRYRELTDAELVP
jgi:hypothetical protein